MLINEKVALSTSRVLLVPYSKHHVPKYHEWMKDPEIQEATASEPLTLEQEYLMQQSWREDRDKLTFIVCQPVAGFPECTESIKANVHDTNETMVGDVNMFITNSDEDNGEARLVGELELMVATKPHQGQGYGRSALLTFLRYVMEHDKEIVDEFLGNSAPTSNDRKLSFFCAKIGQQNQRSIGLFESLGFVKTSSTPSYFGEFELRNETLSLEVFESLLKQYPIEEYTKMVYDSGHGL